MFKKRKENRNKKYKKNDMVHNAKIYVSRTNFSKKKKKYLSRGQLSVL